MKPDNRNEIKRKLKDIKKDVKTQIKNQIIKLRDTSTNNFTLAIKLPTKDYKPKHKLTKQEINRLAVSKYYQKNKERIRQYKRDWFRNKKQEQQEGHNIRKIGSKS